MNSLSLSFYFNDGIFLLLMGQDKGFSSEFTYSSDDLPINPEESFEVIGSFDHRHNFLDTIMMMDLKRPADGSERCC